MTSLPTKALSALSCNALLAIQVLFSVGYVGTCEIANILGSRDLSLCEGRWTTVLALWCPSGLQRAAGTAGATTASLRRRIFGDPLP